MIGAGWPRPASSRHERGSQLAATRPWPIRSRRLARRLATEDKQTFTARAEQHVPASKVPVRRLVEYCAAFAAILKGNSRRLIAATRPGPLDT